MIMQRNRGLYSLVALATLLASLATACGTSIAPPSSKLEKLVIAVQPTNTPETLSADAREIEKLLSTRLAREVQLVFPTTFAGVIEALRFGHAHAAFMSAWPAALAQKHAGAEVVLAEVREVVIDEQKVEAPYYFSYWIVRKDSPITSLEHLHGKWPG
jgi:phosphonate transport system substrate-binding protein